MSKNNRRTKINSFIANELKSQHDIEFHRNIRLLTKEITPHHSTTPITIQVDYKKYEEIDQCISNAVDSVNKRTHELLELFTDIQKDYDDLDMDLICKSYNQLTSIGMKIYNLHEELKYEVEKELLRRDISRYESVTDYPDIFPKARKKKRKIIAYLGDTNSGKTYNAMAKIANSFTAAYLAPLRLLALETYEYLNNQGIPTSLITGEEKIIKEDAWCTSSTVECFNTDKEYDVIVIDEIQMIDDKDRGAFFTQALIGANADEVVLTGPKEYKKRLESIAEILGEEIEVHIFERKSEVKILSKPVDLAQVQKNTAIVTFSRRNIFEIRDLLPKHIKSSVIYGALGYDVRKKQAEQFVNGETDVIITTDAIGMGLNLPIETVLFTTHTKYDGESVKELSQMLTKQIAGRAGRFGKFDIGYVTATNPDTLAFVKSAMNQKLSVDNNAKLGVNPTSDYIETMMVKYQLSTVLSNWNMLKYPEGSMFFNRELTQQTQIAFMLEKFYNQQKVREFYHLIYCPVDFEKDYDVFKFCVKNVIEKGLVKLPVFNPQAPINALEGMLRDSTISLWFAQQFPEMCESGFDGFMETIYSRIDELNNALHKKLSKTNNPQKQKKRKK